jgi:hypothetical protein
VWEGRRTAPLGGVVGVAGAAEASRVTAELTGGRVVSYGDFESRSASREQHPPLRASALLRAASYTRRHNGRRAASEVSC